MELDEIIWAYIPILIAIIEIGLSLKLAVTHKNSKTWIWTILIITLNGFSIYMLILILNKYWPSFLPHIGIGLGTIFLGIQYYLMGKKK